MVVEGWDWWRGGECGESRWGSEGDCGGVGEVDERNSGIGEVGGNSMGGIDGKMGGGGS